MFPPPFWNYLSPGLCSISLPHFRTKVLVVLYPYQPLQLYRKSVSGAMTSYAQFMTKYADMDVIGTNEKITMLNRISRS